jgi:polysaccharide biosynthesis/export protein
LSATPLLTVLGLPELAEAKPRATTRPSNTSRQAPSRPQIDPYTLGAGDRVRIDVLNVPEYSGEFIVLVDGSVNLPVIGAVPVGGYTLSQASTSIQDRYKVYVRIPTVTVSLLLARPIQVTIAGEVSRAGSYNIPLSETRKFPTLSQAIQLAGGVNQTSDLRQVRVRRGNRAGIFDMLAVLQSGDPRQDFTLRDGDSIFIL